MPSASDTPANAAAFAASAPIDGTAPLEAVMQADQWYAQSQFLLAQQAFKTLVERYPRNAYFWFRLGNCEVQLGHHGQAVDAFQQAVALDPNDGRFTYNLAFAHGALARDAFAQSRKQLPSGSPLRREAEQNWRLMGAVVGMPASAP